MIQNIDIKNLSPHPHNPRTDLGDLTELVMIKRIVLGLEDKQ